MLASAAAPAVAAVPNVAAFTDAAAGAHASAMIAACATDDAVAAARAASAIAWTFSPRRALRRKRNPRRANPEINSPITAPAMLDSASRQVVVPRIRLLSSRPMVSAIRCPIW